MDADFPAAHSMDTTWFAVDRDGHVGYFNSGEAGAVPNGAFSGQSAEDDLTERLAELLPRGGAVHDLDGRKPFPGSGEIAGRHHPVLTTAYSRVLMFLRSLDPLREEIAARRAVSTPSSTGAAVVFLSLSEELAQRLHDQGHCLGCSNHYGWDEASVGEPSRLAELGLYDYSHLTENWISGPYGRQALPLKPVHIDQLPPDLRDQLRGVRFDKLCFAEAPFIQPVEHAECSSWESYYLDSKGKRRSLATGEEEGDDEDEESPDEGAAE